MSENKFSFRSPYCSVYAIQCESGEIKIGIANDVQSRLKELQVGTHQQLEVLETLKVNNREMALEIEKLLHEHYKAGHVRGEWYFIDPDELHRDIALMRGVNRVTLAHVNQNEARRRRQEYSHPFLALDTAAEFELSF